MRALVTDRFDEAALERLRAGGLEVEYATSLKGDALYRAVAAAHVLVVRSQTQVDEKLLAAAGALLVVGRAGVGCDNIDVEACKRLGIPVINTPGASAITTAERAIALILAMLHLVPAGDRHVRAGLWDRRGFKGSEAYGKSLGVLGFGNIGRLVAHRASGMLMRVFTHDPAKRPDEAFNVGVTPVGFDELLRTAHIVTCHVSADRKNEKLIGARELALMQPGSWLVNTSRGFVVDEAALVDALRSGHLRGAALDVFADEPPPPDSPLRQLDNVVLSPHLGASTTEAEARSGQTLAVDLLRFLETGTAQGLVAAPSFYRHERARRT